MRGEIITWSVLPCFEIKATQHPVKTETNTTVPCICVNMSLFTAYFFNLLWKLNLLCLSARLSHSAVTQLPQHTHIKNFSLFCLCTIKIGEPCFYNKIKAEEKSDYSSAACIRISSNQAPSTLVNLFTNYPRNLVPRSKLVT